MSLPAAEANEESLSSPVISTKKSPSIFSVELFRTNDPELEHNDPDPCSPILDRKKSKMGKHGSLCTSNISGTKSSDVNKDNENILNIAVKKLTENSNDHSGRKNTTESFKKQVETKISDTSSFSNPKKIVCTTDQVSKTSKTRLFSHDSFDDIKSFSKDSLVLNEQDLEKCLDRNKPKEFCSPVVKNITKSSKKQLETKMLDSFCFSSSNKVVSVTDKVSKTSIVRLFSHDSHNDIKNFSKDSLVSNEEDLEKGSDQGKSKEFCSPEIKSKQRIFLSAVSPEIKTKKSCLDSSRKRKSKNYKDVKNLSQSEESLPVINSSTKLSSKWEPIVQEKPTQLDRTSEKNLNSENQYSSKNFKFDSSERNNSFCVSQNESPFVSSKKQGDSKSSSISSTTELIENSQSDLKNCEIKGILQPDLSTSPILKIKLSTLGKVKKKSLITEERVISQSEKSFLPQENIFKKCLRTNQPTENIAHQAPDTKSTRDPWVTPYSWSANKETQDARQEISSMISSPLTSHSAKQNLVRYSLPISKHSPFNENSVNFSTIASSSNSTNIDNVRKRLGFQSSSTEKRKSKNNKPTGRLSLTKTNNLETQFSKFSEFCKLNSSLTTKSPSSVTIRKSKLKKFYASKDEEFSAKKDFNYTESYDLNRSPSPILQSSVHLDFKNNLPQSTFNADVQLIDPIEKQSNRDEINVKDLECCIEDQTDDDPMSPCLKAPKISNSSKSKSKFFEPKIKSTKKFKFSLDNDSSNFNSDKEHDDLNEPGSPILKVRKKLKLEPDDKVTPCNIDEDQDPQIDVIDVTHADIQDAANVDYADIVDYRTILNETVLDRILEMGETNSQKSLVIEDDVLNSQAASNTSKNQGSMTIEVSESSGNVEQSQISDGNLPCDNSRVKDFIPSPPQSTFPPNNDDLYESGKKRKRRYKNGTLSARLNRLLKRTKSETRMWAHESQSDASSSAAIDLVVQVVAYEMNKWLLKCCFVSDSIGDGSQDVYFVILHPNAISNALITPGIILRVFPKWQTMELPSPKVTVIFNITRVKLIQGTSSTDATSSCRVTKQDVHVTKAYCSCSRDSVRTVCVHNLLKRQILLEPLIPAENRDDS